MATDSPVPAAAQRLISSSVIAGSYLLMLAGEMLFPLRRPVEPKFRRVVRNLTTGAISLAILGALQLVLLVPVARWAMEQRVGLLHLGSLPRWLHVVLAVVLLDYTLWVWHWLNHVVPFFWRFHLVHHVDRDMDASTALRFHFGELTLSLFYRAMQIAVIGADLFSLWLWQTILFASILFHHSNLRLPVRVEQWLVRLIVTPRMHGIHHSTAQNETNSNWSSLLSCWDYLHGTIRLDVPQSSITIGVPAYRAAGDVTIGRILALPFVRQRDDWKLPDGSISVRAPAGPPHRLAE